MSNNELSDDVLDELRKNIYDKAVQESVVNNYKEDFATYMRNTNINLEQNAIIEKMKKPFSQRMKESFMRFCDKILNIF